MPRVTHTRMSELLERVTEDQAYDLGQHVDEPFGKFAKYAEGLGFTRDEAKEIHKYFSYGK